MSEPVDYLIVGSGLAGSLLAWELLQHKCSVIVIDNNHQHASSVVAAGLVNPVTGKRLLKSNDTDDCLEQAISTYKALAQQFGKTFYFAKPMLRLLKDKQQQQALQQRLDDPAYHSYFASDKNCETGMSLQNSHGCIEQLRTGYLDIPALLSSIKACLLDTNACLNTVFDYSALELRDNLINYKGLSAANIIFCEGYQATGNPWFNYLPLQPAKGDILTLKLSDTAASHIINKGTWLLPVTDNIFKTGATSQWHFNDDSTQPDGKKQAEKNFLQLFKIPPEYRITNHQAGIRPATRDKKPFIGQHPKHKRLFIFNGFGAKGSLLIPYYARRFSRFLKHADPLPAAVDIRRFHDLAD